MTTYKDTIISAHKGFNEERRMISLINSINEKNRLQLQAETQSLIKNSTLLSRYQYMIMTKKQFELNESIFPFKDIQVIEPKDKATYLPKVDYHQYQEILRELISKPEIFSQIIYLFLTNQNENAENADERKLSDDDRKYFCYFTFPSIFTFFLTKEMQQNALGLFQKLFDLHFYLHDYQFSSLHLFLNDLLLSYFLNTNPHFFFENTILPLMPTLLTDIPEKSYYKSTGNGVIRIGYWKFLIGFVESLFARMITNKNLLPKESKELIQKVLQLNSSDFPVKYLFIIDTLFCIYFQKFINFDQSEIIRDICSVIRCYYPQDQLPHPLYPQIQSIIKKPTIVDDFLNAFLVESNEAEDEDGVAIGFNVTKSSTYFSPRDFLLIHNMIKLFANNSERSDDLSFFFTISKTLNKPPNGVDHVFAQVGLIVKDSLYKDADINLPPSIITFIDVLNLIDLSLFDFNSIEELKEIVLSYCDCYLNLTQKCQISAMNDFLGSNTEILDNLKEMHKKSACISDLLSNGLILVNKKNSLKNDQIYKYSLLWINHYFLPLLRHLYSYDFRIDAKKLLYVKEMCKRLITNIVYRIAPLSFKQEYQNLIKRCALFDYMNTIDSSMGIQEKASNLTITKNLGKFNEDHANIFHVTDNKYKSVLYAANLFQTVKTYAKVADNMLIVIEAMRSLCIFDDLYTQCAISLSVNPDVFGFEAFLRSYMIANDTIKYIVNGDEKGLLQRFHEAIGVLMNYK